MLEIAIWIVSIFICVALLLNIWRLLRGPSLPDRVLALDTMFINSIALILVWDLYLRTAMYFEAALLIAMLGFVSTVAVCKYLLRGDLIE